MVKNGGAALFCGLGGHLFFEPFTTPDSFIFRVLFLVATRRPWNFCICALGDNPVLGFFSALVPIDPDDGSNQMAHFPDSSTLAPHRTAGFMTVSYTYF